MSVETTPPLQKYNKKQEKEGYLFYGAEGWEI